MKKHNATRGIENYLPLNLAGNTFLLSFCNQTSSPNYSLCAINFEKEISCWFDLSLIPEEFKEGFSGICGLSLSGNFVFAATQAINPIISIFDLEARAKFKYFPLKKCKDAHSIVYHDGYIYIVSTGTNEIYRVQLTDEGTYEEELFWRYPGVDYDKDVVHLNGLTIDVNGQWIASCFGPRKSADNWKTDCGRIFFLESGCNIVTGLKHPHTPLIINNQLLFAESLAGKIHIYQKNQKDSWVLNKTISLDGYPRGITSDGQNLLVALSVNRHRSRSQGKIVGEDSNKLSSVFAEINWQTREVQQKYSLLEYGREIYDVFLLPKSNQLNFVSNADALVQRIWDMEVNMDSLLGTDPKIEVREKSFFRRFIAKFWLFS